MDEVYGVVVEKQGKDTLEFIITLEEIPGENRVVATQYDEFWNEMVAIVYEDKEIRDITVNEEIPPTASTNGFRSWWACTTMKYKLRKEVIEADASLDLLCDLSNIAMGSCYAGTFLRAATSCL